jgi:hypothetical protein
MPLRAAALLSLAALSRALSPEPPPLASVADQLEAAVAACDAPALGALLASLDAQRAACVAGGGSAYNLTALAAQGVSQLPAWLPCALTPSSRPPHAAGLAYGPPSLGGFGTRKKRLALSPKEALALLRIESLPNLAAALLCAPCWQVLARAGWPSGGRAAPLAPRGSAMAACNESALPGQSNALRSYWLAPHYKALLSPQFLWCRAAPKLAALEPARVEALEALFGARAAALALAADGNGATTVATLDAIFCGGVGARLAELQLRVLLEEMHERKMRVRMAGEAVRVRANFVHGFRKLEVELEKRT